MLQNCADLNFDRAPSRPNYNVYSPLSVTWFLPSIRSCGGEERHEVADDHVLNYGVSHDDATPRDILHL